MNMLHVSDIAKAKAENAILLTGSARSGTTIVGKVLHSFKLVEYVFEPPTLIGLIALIEELNEHDWKLIYETYLYEDFFLNAIAGRSVNCNISDDSSIFRVKSESEIEERLQNSLGKVEAEEKGAGRLVAYKIPDIVPFVPRMLQYYPGTKVVMMRRDAVGTLNSLIEKQWFSDEYVNTNIVWPFRIIENSRIPYWVKETDGQAWIGMSELDRCAYYYIRVNEDAEAIRNRIDVRYSDLTENPESTARELAEKLGLEFGDKTNAIIHSIKITRKERDERIIGRVRPDLAEMVRYYSDLS